MKLEWNVLMQDFNSGKIKNCNIFGNDFILEIQSAEIKKYLELRDELKNIDIVEDLYSVSDNAVRKWCKSYGLPYKSKDIKLLKLAS